MVPQCSSETLKGMGLFVSPIPEADDPAKIREMIVSADLPTAETAAEAGVSFVVKRTEVGKIVPSPSGGGDTVIDLTCQ